MSVDNQFAELLTAVLAEGVEPVAAGVTLQQIAAAADGKAPELIAMLASKSGDIPGADPAIVAALLRLVHHSSLHGGDETIRLIDPQDLVSILDSITFRVPNSHLPLHLLAMKRDRESMELLVDRLAEHPPEDWIAAAQVLSPLMQRTDWPIDAFFPAALDLIAAPSLASPVLDLAAFTVREMESDVHPAASRIAMLNHLLGEVTQRLAQFEENARAFGDDVSEVQAKLGQAVSLAVSLCDNVGLIGDESSIGKLNQTVLLRHRRVQCEAAGALAQLGQPDGRNRLIELAADPAARLRAIAYADELGFGDKIDDAWRTVERTAESEMALWLTQPAQMGVPPTGLEMIESRLLSWPGFDNPVDVRLVRFEYNFGTQTYSNVGITGPITFSLSTDVADLPVDDIFAIYAGWQAEHDEIFAVPAESLNEAQKRIMAALAGHLEREGYADIRPALKGIFLDETAGVFSARKDNTELLVITDGLEIIDCPVGGRLRPMTPGDVFNLYKGRKMLRTFNGASFTEESFSEEL